MSTSSRHGTLAILAAVLCWGLLGVMAKSALAGGTPPLTIAFWRASIAAILFTAHATVRREKALRAADRPAAIALGIAGVALFYVAYLNSVELGGAALSAILLYSAPLWVAVGGWVFFQERVGLRGGAALTLTLMGVVAVALSNGLSELTVSGGAVGWGLLSGATYSLYYLVGRRLFSHNGSARVMSWALSIGALTMLPFVDLVPVPLNAWGGIAFLAVVCTYAAYLAYAEGVKRLPAARAATIATLEPVIAVIAAYVVWGERLSLVGLAGGAAVVLGVLLTATEGPRTDSASPHPPATL